jgi:p-aminobenzoyl-glutamate transporter AbgT
MSQSLDTTEAASAVDRRLMARMLDGIERIGNKMPNPAVLFLLLCVVIIVLSQVLFWLNVRARYETVTPPPVPTLRPDGQVIRR